MDENSDNNHNGNGNTKDKWNLKRGKPPDKRRYNVEIDYYTNLIEEKEKLLSFDVSKTTKLTPSLNANREELLGKIQLLKTKKDEKMKQKQAIDAEIKVVNEKVRKKNEACMKLQANIKHKDDQRLNNAIKHLETHLSTKQLKLSEEKKLVSEIDALKRSKKTLSEYLNVKQEVDQLRQQQVKFRSERDDLIRQMRDIRAKENDIKVSLDSIKEEKKESEEEHLTESLDRDALKKEIDSLYEKRRELQESFQKALASYHEEQKQTEAMVEKVRAEKKRDEQRLAKLYKKRQGKKWNFPSYEEERNVCVCLIQYLQSFNSQYTASKYEDVPEEEPYNVNPDDNLGGLFVQSNRSMKRKSIRKGRKTKDVSAQKLVLHPDVFQKFEKLSLDPPLYYADINVILEKLKHKKEFYQRESEKMYERAVKNDIRPNEDYVSQSEHRFQENENNDVFHGAELFVKVEREGIFRREESSVRNAAAMLNQRSYTLNFLVKLVFEDGI
ncbi:golgin subfamily A member 6-like protein 2 isoform X2 [Xenia sp. Carnegie-2017]|uniref:golgin subfamily A member 6-like protein 2 isoform X2 n=1 Tax=Xenia sp. Carnegie-2017 TaxID=2897299 RepID=UPI001F04725D|nr:golgin subfamily A member 6-like protein 2 isoform X2 [Xenia sp. Carnegie-2017]